VPRIRAAVARHPAVRDVTPVGSRAGGRPTALSDWDLAVATDRFDEVAADLPSLTAPLRPLGALWDPLARHAVFMVVLPGPVKVDLVFDRGHDPGPPWVPGPATLAALDAHFWDWALWLGSKALAGRDGLVLEQLAELHRFVLGPLGVGEVPADLDAAVTAYGAARWRAAARHRVAVAPALGDEVSRALRNHGLLRRPVP
jgi:hypothetical protein